MKKFWEIGCIATFSRNMIRISVLEIVWFLDYLKTLY